MHEFSPLPPPPPSLPAAAPRSCFTLTLRLLGQRQEHEGEVEVLTKQLAAGRGLHSFTCQLNLSALYGIGGARRGCVARVKRVFRVCRVFHCVIHGSR